MPAYRAERKWRERIRAGLLAFLSFLDEEPVIGRLLIVESLSGGARVLESRNRVLAMLAEAIDEGRGQSVNGTSLPPLTAEGLAGGALALIQARITLPGHGSRAMAGGRLFALANQLVSMIVLPYLGPAAARRELQRPLGQRASAPENTGEAHDGRLLKDPFKGMGMRLTIALCGYSWRSQSILARPTV